MKRVLVVDLNVVQQLLDAGIDVYSLQLPPTLSINTYALQAGDPAEALGALLRTAHWLGKGQAVPVTTMPAPTTNNGMREDDVDEDVAEDELEELIDDDEEDADLDEGVQVEMSPTIRTASPLPPAPHEVEAEVDADEVRLTFGNRRYRVRGLSKNLSYDVLKVNVLVSNDTGLFVDTFDLYSAKHRRSFVVQAAQELHVEEQTIKTDLAVSC